MVKGFFLQQKLFKANRKLLKVSIIIENNPIITVYDNYLFMLIVLINTVKRYKYFNFWLIIRQFN